LFYLKNIYMSDLRLNDVWRRVNQEILFFTADTFNDVPAVAGIYAWFYPLRIVTNNIDEFIEEVQIILNYDCETKGAPSRESKSDINWETFIQKIEIQSKKVDLSSFQHTWDEFSKDQKKFDDLRKIIMRASILLSPLYVGKASNLKIRCYQHINGNGSDNSFHKRFEDYANKVNSKSKKVSDLLFVAIKTEETQGESQESEKLVEGILKNLVKPKYSII
jgi:hypothetical protein